MLQLARTSRRGWIKPCVHERVIIRPSCLEGGGNYERYPGTANITYALQIGLLSAAGAVNRWQGLPV